MAYPPDSRSRFRLVLPNIRILQGPEYMQMIMYKKLMGIFDQADTNIQLITDIYVHCQLPMERIDPGTLHARNKRSSE